MAIERERKFLVDPKLLPEPAFGKYYDVTAGYFTDGPVAIRVTSRLGGKQKICFKGPVTDVASGARQEFEYIIPKEDAEALLQLSPTLIKKRRYEFEGWEIDHFEFPMGDGKVRHFWMAEWEEAHQSNAPLDDSKLPPWVTAEVTHYPEYSNMRIAWSHFRKEK